jgi:hypothetical protein
LQPHSRTFFYEIKGVASEALGVKEAGDYAARTRFEKGLYYQPREWLVWSATGDMNVTVSAQQGPPAVILYSVSNSLALDAMVAGAAAMYAARKIGSTVGPAFQPRRKPVFRVAPPPAVPDILPDLPLLD